MHYESEYHQGESKYDDNSFSVVPSLSSGYATLKTVFLSIDYL